jgi:hypothetical protein
VQFLHFRKGKHCQIISLFVAIKKETVVVTSCTAKDTVHLYTWEQLDEIYAEYKDGTVVVLIISS